MRLIRLLFFLAVLLLMVAAPGPGAHAQETAAPDAAATLNYIHAAWDTLTRSATDCNSLTDVKVDPGAADGVARAAAVLYLPADMPTSPKLNALVQSCHVRVLVLPRKIAKLGDVRPEELKAPGLLYLPNPYIVPGGRFNEMYGWDSYFIVLGLEADHREDLAKGMVDNFLFEIENYGAVLNANRTYYLTRSQPPFLTSMIRAVFENPASFEATPAGRIKARAWLAHAYTLAEKDYATWDRPEHKAGTTGLSRYWDYGNGPVPEMADDSTYYTDVIRWLVAHPHEGGDGFLLKAAEHPDATEAERLKQTSCDVHGSVVCERAWFGGYRLSREFYEGDRAMRESGFDTSNRFGPLLLGNDRDAAHWDRRSQQRAAAIQRYLWRAKDGVFADFNFVHAKSSSYDFIASLYPLWAGFATREEATQMESKLNLFERAGGLSTSNTNTGLQWDEPYGWAPTNWMVVAGLEAYGFRADAARIAEHFDATVDAGFAADGTIREKYNVVKGNSDVKVSTGYTANVIGFGWTNAIYLKMQEISEKPVVTKVN
jgi:alpha,alpha-trehalase